MRPGTDGTGMDRIEAAGIGTVGAGTIGAEADEARAGMGGTEADGACPVKTRGGLDFGVVDTSSSKGQVSPESDQLHSTDFSAGRRIRAGSGSATDHHEGQDAGAGSQPSSTSPGPTYTPTGTTASCSVAPPW